MRKWRWLLAGLGATVVACSGGEEDAVVGKWKRSDNQRILEFVEGGTLTEVHISRNVYPGNFGNVTQGATYRFPEEGKLQIERPRDGPVTYGYEMMGDSMVLVSVGGARSTYYRDTGEIPPVTYQLRTIDGGAVPHVTEIRRVTSMWNDTTLYEGGTLILDPLTHTYTQKLTVRVAGGEYRPLGAGRMRSFGTYTLDGETLTLRDENKPSQPPLTGTLRGDQLSYVTQEYDPASEQYTPGPVLEYAKQ